VTLPDTLKPPAPAASPALSGQPPSVVLPPASPALPPLTLTSAAASPPAPPPPAFPPTFSWSPLGSKSALQASADVHARAMPKIRPGHQLSLARFIRLHPEVALP
jgi:hypothetical protein